MLRLAGLDARPVLLSTRTNGALQRVYPIVEQFDYVIARVVVGKTKLLIDATEKNSPFSLLPLRALNHDGMEMWKDSYEWISVDPVGKWRRTTTVNATLKEDGTLSGQVNMAFAEYGAGEQRNNYAEKKRDQFIRELLATEYAGIHVDTFNVAPLDSIGTPLLVNATISADGYAQVLNNYMYVHPFVVNRREKNPFTLEHRTFPVDYGYPYANNLTATLTIPEGFRVKEIPDDQGFRLPSNAASFSRSIRVEGRLVRLNSSMEINSTLFTSNQYGGLRDFYTRMIAVENEQIVLERIPPESQATPAKPTPSTVKSPARGKK
jgi:hypothetical protein